MRSHVLFCESVVCIVAHNLLLLRFSYAFFEIMECNLFDFWHENCTKIVKKIDNKKYSDYVL